MPPDNPAGVASLEDLAKPGTKVVVCASGGPLWGGDPKVEKAGGCRQSGL